MNEHVIISTPFLTLMTVVGSSIPMSIHHSTSHDEYPQRAVTLGCIENSLRRFPLLVSLMNHLRPAPLTMTGDQELRSACGRAMTSMLADLSQIPPAPPISRDADAREKAIFEMIRNSEALELLDPDQLQRLDSLVVRLLPTA